MKYNYERLLCTNCEKSSTIRRNAYIDEFYSNRSRILFAPFLED
jgi:hypothetical protein